MNPDHREGGWGVLLYVMAINTDKGSSVLSFVYRSIISKKLKKKLKILVSFEVKRQKKNQFTQISPPDFDFYCPSPSLFSFLFSSLMPVNVSGKTGMTSQHEWTVTLDTLAGALAGVTEKIHTEKNKNKTPHQNKTHISRFRCKPTCLIAIIRPYKHSEEAAGMAADYLRESNNVGVCFLSHSRACNKPLAFVSTTLSRRMTSALKQ